MTSSINSGKVASRNSGSHNSGSTGRSSNFGVRSVSSSSEQKSPNELSFEEVARNRSSIGTPTSYDLCSVGEKESSSSEQKIPAKKVAEVKKQQSSSVKSSKSRSAKDKPPKPENYKELGISQDELIKLMNVVLLNDISTLRYNNKASVENIENCKELITNTYAKNFHPKENNLRSFSDTLRAVKMSISQIKKYLELKENAKDVEENVESFTMVSDDAINLTHQEAMGNFRFTKDDFKNTRIQF